MTTEPELVVVYSGPLVDAERAYSALEGHGILAQLLDQSSSIGGVFPVTVVVHPTDVEAARDVLQESGLMPES
jgi:hypothetical protein